MTAMHVMLAVVVAGVLVAAGLGVWSAIVLRRNRQAEHGH